MTTTSRRALLQGLAITSAFAAPAALAATTPAQSADAELLALEADLHRLDATIAGMARASAGRDLDEMPGHDDAETCRFEVLDALARVPAFTLAGIAAKARVLKTRDVEEDYMSTCEIAASMADDVLRLLGTTV